MSYNRTKRPSFSKAQRQAFIQIHARICHWCLRPISEAEKWQVEHVIPRELMPGKEADDPSNLRPIHTDPCHKAKTALDVKLIAKSNRIIRKAGPIELRKVKKKIGVRPFPKGRGFNGVRG